MKFEFKINKYYLVGYAIASKNKPFPSWKKLEERIWQKYKEEPAYYFLNPKYISLAIERLQTSFDDKNIEKVFKNYSLKLKKIYKEIFKTKEFKRLFKETEKHLLLAKKQWNKNEKEALKILQDISGLPLPKHKITVYITHPSSHNGKVLSLDKIAWGHSEDWENYSTVYLCHELLHIMTWPGHFQPNFDILHALICLVANNELRIKLNKQGSYFKENGFYTETSEIRNLEKKILLYWKKYLRGNLGKNILDLKRILSKTNLTRYKKMRTS
jgi:hypothetical protein